MRKLVLSTALLMATAFGAAAQQGPVKLGVLNDQSSSFSALGGTEVVDAVRLAIQDFGGQVLGKPIEVVGADHQNKPDLALSISREWIDNQHVDAMFDIANSAIAISMNNLFGERKKTLGFFVSPITDRMTEDDCNGYGLGWAYDTYSIARASVKAQIARGGESWFILSPDYEAGKLLEETVKSAVTESGGKVVEAIRAPLGTTDFSSYILRAQASGAKVIGLTLNGPELVNALKQIQEYNLIERGQRVALTVLHQSDARSIGLQVLQGIQFASPWYWNTDDASRKFEQDMMKKTGNAPGWVAAGAYSAATEYLTAVKAVGNDDPQKVLAKLRDTKINDLFAHNATLWPNGRLIHDMYLLEVRKPGEVADKQDVFKVVSTVPAADAFRPLKDTKCKLAK